MVLLGCVFPMQCLKHFKIKARLTPHVVVGTEDHVGGVEEVVAAAGAELGLAVAQHHLPPAEQTQHHVTHCTKYIKETS